MFLSSLNSKMGTGTVSTFWGLMTEVIVHRESLLIWPPKVSAFEISGWLIYEEVAQRLYTLRYG